MAEAAFRKINALAQSNHDGARKLVSYFVGQGVGLMNEPTTVRNVVYDFMEDFANAQERLAATMED